MHSKTMLGVFDRRWELCRLVIRQRRQVNTHAISFTFASISGIGGGGDAMFLSLHGITFQTASASPFQTNTPQCYHELIYKIYTYVHGATNNLMFLTVVDHKWLTPEHLNSSSQTIEKKKGGKDENKNKYVILWAAGLYRPPFCVCRSVHINHVCFCLHLRNQRDVLSVRNIVCGPGAWVRACVQSRCAGQVHVWRVQSRREQEDLAMGRLRGQHSVWTAVHEAVPEEGQQSWQRHSGQSGPAQQSCWHKGMIVS